MTRKLTNTSTRHSANVEVGDSDLQYLWEVTQHFKCQELWDLWCLRVARHTNVWEFTQKERDEFFNEYSIVVTKLQHAVDTGYVFSN